MLVTPKPGGPARPMLGESAVVHETRKALVALHSLRSLRTQAEIAWCSPIAKIVASTAWPKMACVPGGMAMAAMSTCLATIRFGLPTCIAAIRPAGHRPVQPGQDPKPEESCHGTANFRRQILEIGVLHGPSFVPVHHGHLCRLFAGLCDRDLHVIRQPAPVLGPARDRRPYPATAGAFPAMTPIASRTMTSWTIFRDGLRLFITGSLLFRLLARRSLIGCLGKHGRRGKRSKCGNRPVVPGENQFRTNEQQESG